MLKVTVRMKSGYEGVHNQTDFSKSFTPAEVASEIHSVVKDCTILVLDNAIYFVREVEMLRVDEA